MDETQLGLFETIKFTVVLPNEKKSVENGTF